MNNSVWEVWMDSGIKAKVIYPQIEKQLSIRNQDGFFFLLLKKSGTGNPQPAMCRNWLVPIHGSRSAFLPNSTLRLQFKIGHTGSIYTIEVGSWHKSELFSQNWLLDLSQHILVCNLTPNTPPLTYTDTSRTCKHVLLCLCVCVNTQRITICTLSPL